MATNNILEVSYNDENGKYGISIPQGMSVNETIFAMSVVIKCLVKDNYIKDYKEALKMIKRYCTDSQFEEVKEEEENGKTEEK